MIVAEFANTLVENTGLRKIQPPRSWRLASAGGIATAASNKRKGRWSAPAALSACPQVCCRYFLTDVAAGFFMLLLCL